jgi:phage terminase large subunit-like protein
MYATLNPYEAAGLLDVNPVQASGNMASRAWFLKTPAPPGGRVVKKVRYWDCAATTSKKSDFTASGCVWKYDDGKECIADVTLDRIGYAMIGDAMLKVAQADGFDVEQWIEFEKGSMGLIGPSELARPMIAKGYKVMLAKRPAGAKHFTWFGMLNRAHTSYARHGGMLIVDGTQTEQFLADVDATPSPAHDDNLDAVSGASDAVNGTRECEAAVGGGMGMVVR